MYVCCNKLLSEENKTVHNDELFSEVSEDRTRDIEVTFTPFRLNINKKHNSRRVSCWVKDIYNHSIIWVGKDL